MTGKTPDGRSQDAFDRNVIRAMAKWPDVPECYDWLKLDRRGRWLLRGSPVTHPNAVAFINQHYAADRYGRWYFQNGPQRVFVVLEYTPWVYLINGTNEITTHTGRSVASLEGLFVDPDGNLLLATEWGAGILCDRDLQAFIEAAAPCTDTAMELGEFLSQMPHGNTCEISWCGHPITVAGIEVDDLEQRFGFVRIPEAMP